MFGLDGSALVTGTVAPDAAYTESVDIDSRIDALHDLADIYGNGHIDALTDGLLLLRGMFGLDGSSLVTGTLASDAVYTDSVDIEARIEILGDLLDIDGNGQIDALSDGLLTLRYLFGLEGDTLINGVLAGDATRTSAEEIEAYIETLMPAL